MGDCKKLIHLMAFIELAKKERGIENNSLHGIP
jgi:hypothetical protein